MITANRPIKGYEGKYSIANDGTVFSLLNNRPIAKELSNTGYYRVTLWNKGKCKHYSIHRLVAEAFVDNPMGKPYVNHINGCKTDNRSANLEWCTDSENIIHAYKNGLINPCTTKVEQYSKDGILIKTWESVKDASKTLGINHANIVTVCGGKTNRKLAGGFIWRYAK